MDEIHREVETGRPQSAKNGIAGEPLAEFSKRF
jgi:hypothetical protein